mmetsp:Transcript_31042/g.52442  ORF Transcript_31042/g.52442 Transcript_31042/m.52442 type:complete len:377 (+) Transcript_31042:69-1199(+)
MRVLPRVCLALSLILRTARGDYAFLSVGDWGGAALKEEDAYTAYENVYAVSSQMASTAAANSARFIIGTGDNFYWCGVQNSSDYQFSVDFEEPYAAEALQVKWYHSLGNHEYGYNVQAQIDYMDINPIWIMPDRYYTQRIEMDTGVYMTLIVLDTTPCISDYRNDNPQYWDPCSTEYPTCSIYGGDDDFEGECELHKNVLTQSCAKQYLWLKLQLELTPKDDWLVVVGHHPIDEVDVEDFTTLIQEHGFSIYLNGHAHTLTQYTIDGAGAYVTTGAGALVNTADQTHPITAAKLAGQPITREMRRQHRFNVNASDTATYDDHDYEKVWQQTVAGFTLHKFNSDFTSLTTEFISYTGDVVHSLVVNKQGEITSQAAH